MGLPLLAKLYGRISTAFKTNTTYKEELRTTLRNHFSDFADGFNHLIAAAEDTIPGTGLGARILFAIDGTDRLGGDDAHAFFAADVHQLQQVLAIFVYCAPVHLAYQGSTVSQNFSAIFRLPMIKLLNSDGSPHEEGRTAMREMLHRHAENDRFDDASGHQAVREMAADFRRILNPDDYLLLATIDAGHSPPSDSERVRYLLYNLALLEYNDYFWRSHPVIRSTQEYMTAQDSLAESDE